jgi:hypothetical protein
MIKRTQEYWKHHIDKEPDVLISAGVPDPVYYLEGGIYTDTKFEILVEGTAEHYGPFYSRKEARVKWWEATCKNVDICCHRIFIVRG